jgi:DNA-binding NarL/FixJ family response regulator
VREAEVIALITQGMSNQDIAHTLALSTNTIKSYIRSAYRRMNVTSRSTAILWAVDHGFSRPRYAGPQPSSIPRPRSPSPARKRR